MTVNIAIWDPAGSAEDVSTMSPAAAAIELQQRLYEMFDIETELYLQKDGCIALSFNVGVNVTLCIEPCDKNKHVAKFIRFETLHGVTCYGQVRSVISRVGSLIMWKNSQELFFGSASLPRLRDV